MSTTAKLRYLRIAPRKVRLVANLIRGKSVKEAQNILNFTLKKATQPLLKLLKSAISSAVNNFQLDETNLFISKITVDEGPKYKRYLPRARGQASEIQKKTSHVTIVLDEIIKKTKEVKKVRKIKKVQKMEEKKIKIKKPKIEPKTKQARPKIEKGIKRVFRRKSF